MALDAGATLAEAALLARHATYTTVDRYGYGYDVRFDPDRRFAQMIGGEVAGIFFEDGSPAKRSFRSGRSSLRASTWERSRTRRR